MHILRAERLIDGTGAVPIDNGAVVIDGDRIAFAGTWDDARHHSGESAKVVGDSKRFFLKPFLDPSSSIRGVSTFRRQSVRAFPVLNALRRDDSG